MEQTLDMLREYKSLFGSAVMIAGVIILLVVLNRWLRRSEAEMSGRRFRNQLIMSGALFCSLIIIILSLPIGSTKQGQLITLIGIIISAGIALSSSTILGNAMAGIMLKTVRNFRSGDFVEATQFFGRVTERGLFHTEIQTANRDLVTLPNLYLASHPVKVIRSSGTVVSATVSLGYDIPQARIKKLLLAAAEGIELQEPFVQVLELGDFSVVYRIAGILKEPKQLLAYRSRLRSAVLDSLHGGGVEIVSPHFRNVRNFEPADTFIPAKERAPRKEATDAAPVDVVFDKAEVAASLSALELEIQDLDAKLKEARQAVKSAEDDQAKQRAEREVASLERRLAEATTELAAVQEKEKEQNT